MKKETWPSGALSVYREPLGCVEVSVLSAGMISRLFWEYWKGVCWQQDVMPMGSCTVGRAVGLAMAWAVVGGLTRAISCNLDLLFLGERVYLGLLACLGFLSPLWGVLLDGCCVFFCLHRVV